MTIREIAALPVATLADPEGCHLYLWVTNNYLRAGLDCMKAWGFEYITTITWLKDRQGLGQYYRGLTEHCLFGSTTRRLPYKIEDGRRCQGVTGFFEPKREHSRKPETMRRMIEAVSYAPRIELFARERVEGWDAWGNEAPDAGTTGAEDITEQITMQEVLKNEWALPRKNVDRGNQGVAADCARQHKRTNDSKAGASLCFE